MDTDVCPGAEESQRNSRRLILVSAQSSGVDSHEAMLHRVRERIRALVVESWVQHRQCGFWTRIG